jgi:hypothetical protein
LENNFTLWCVLQFELIARVTPSANPPYSAPKARYIKFYLKILTKKKHGIHVKATPSIC